MKELFKFLGFLVIVIIMASCKKSKDKDVVAEPMLSVSSSEELFTADAGVSEVTVTSNTQ